MQNRYPIPRHFLQKVKGLSWEQGKQGIRGLRDMRGVRRLRHAYRPKRLLLSALVILLLVPAGVLAVRSLFTSFAAAEEVKQHKKTVTEKVKRESLGPYGGTPAAGFPEGEAGISVPEPVALGDHPAETVAAVQQQVKEALIAARTNEQVLAGDVGPYVSILAESARQFAGEQAAGPQALGYVTRLAPGYSLAAPVRVSGELRVHAGENRELVIDVQLVWAYVLNGEVAQEMASEPGAKVAMLRTSETYYWIPEKGYLPADHGLRPGDGQHYLFNADCENAASGILGLPREPSNTNEKVRLDAVYDPATPLEKLESTC